VSFGEQVAPNFNQERLIARLAELFGVLALILPCVGLYGVTAYAVVRRTNEIGIRMAIALAGGRVLAGQFYGVKSYDPLMLGLAVVILAACALLSASVPARRATRVDPIAALRTSSPYFVEQSLLLILDSH
jgi:ABC-type antimicrobial peptide transport system permease subunit